MNKKEKRSARCLCIQLLYSSELSDNCSSKDIAKSFFKEKDKDLDEIIYSKNEIDYATKLSEYTFKYIGDLFSWSYISTGDIRVGAGGGQTFGHPKPK